MSKFKAGTSGNPAGRPKGSKNQITLLKESLELALREEAQPHMSEVLQAAIERAKAGSEAMIKLLLELHMSKGTTQDNSKAAEKVQINISGPETSVKKEESVPIEEVALLLSSNGEAK